MGKYEPLRRFLLDRIPTVAEASLTFDQIERILGDTLPKSARRHRQWWENELGARGHVQAAAWLGAGWRVDSVSLEREWVRFRRAP